MYKLLMFWLAFELDMPISSVQHPSVFPFHLVLLIPLMLWDGIVNSGRASANYVSAWSFAPDLDRMHVQAHEPHL